MKKICVFLAVIIVIMTAAGFVPAAAVQLPYNENLLLNGDFEKIAEDGAAANWAGFNTWNNGSKISLVTGDSCPEDGGNNCAKIDVTAEGDNPFIAQGTNVIPGGCKYRLSFWLKGVTPQKMSVKIGEYDQNGAGIKEHYSDGYYASGVWRRLDFEFYAQKNTHSITVMPRGYKAGTCIYVDCVSLVALEGPVQFDISTDWTFYYEEFDKTQITLTMDEFYADPGYTVDFEIHRGLSVPVASRGYRFTDRKIELDMDITSLKKKTEYILKAVVKNPDGSTWKTVTQPIYRIDRPTNMTKDGVYMVDGEIFEPVFAYHFDMKDAADAVKAGVNVIQWAPSNGLDRDITFSELDAIHAAGLKAAVVCYWGMQPAGSDRNKDLIPGFVEMIKDHPAVFCYMIMDEPFAHNPNVEDELRNSYKIIRMRDDKHPVYCCESIPDKYRVTAKYVDILCADIYPGKGDFSKDVADTASRAKVGTEGIKPLYVLVQSMSWGGIIPDGPMLRTQLFQAILAGAKAVGYYPWVPDNPEIDVNLNVSRYWDTMVSFHEIDQPLLYSYFGRGEHEQYNVYHGNNYWYESWVADGGIYYALISRSPIGATATLSVVGADGEKLIENYDVEVINGDDTPAIAKSGNGFTVHMDGYHAAIYKVIPGAKNDSQTVHGNQVTNGDFETGAAEGNESITGWTNPEKKKAVYKIYDGNSVAALPAFAVLRQQIPITSWEEDGENHGYVFSADLNYNSGGYPAFAVTAAFEDGTEVSRVVNIVRSASDVTDPETQISATLWQWNRLEYDVSPLTENRDSKLTSVTVELFGMGGGCEYDNISLSVKAKDGKKTPEILFFENYGEITGIDQIESEITARAYNPEKGDRLFLALYTQDERLYKIAATSAEGVNSIYCTVEKGTKCITKIRAFLWTANLGAKLLKILE